MEVSQYTRVDFSSSIYVGGSLDAYYNSVVVLNNLRSISGINSTFKTESVSGWGQDILTVYDVPAEPVEAEFMVNLTRANWLANQPLPNLWKDKRERACRIVYKNSAADAGFQLKFLCRPASWSLSTSLTDATVIRCSILITSVIEPELL
jgi:hypothetical protein